MLSGAHSKANNLSKFKKIQLPVGGNLHAERGEMAHFYDERISESITFSC